MMVGGTGVRVDGRPLDAALATKLVEVRVESHLQLPDLAVIRLADPGLEHVDDDPLPIGAKLEVLFSAPESTTLKRAFAGVVTTLEPEFTSTGAYLVARAYDASHALTRARNTRTFQKMSADDIARKLAREAGLRAGQIDSAGPAYAFVQQSDETDWALLWRLAASVDFEVVAEEDKLHFRRAGGNAQDPAIDLRWGDQLLAFRPRLTGAQQVDSVTVRGWDPAGKRAITAVAQLGSADSEPGAGRASVKPSGAVALGDRPVEDQDEADALARSVAARLAHAYVEVDGTCRGEPRLKAGGRIRIDGVGQRFGGTYAPTAVTHLFRGGHGYVTRFSVSGRTPRGLLATTSAPRRAWGSGLVIGLVTQNSDPDKLGRIRVRYPTLGDDVEGAWARIAAPGAGPSRGALMLPAVGDEVVLGFEHGDLRRPYVLGALWNGKARPEDLAQTDGTYSLKTDAKLVVTAKDDIKIKGGNDLEITSDGKSHQKATGDLVVEGATVKVKSDGEISVESNQQLTLKAPKVSVQATGQLTLSGSTVSIG
jgi:phage protein D